MRFNWECFHYAFRKQTRLIFIAESKSIIPGSVYQTAGISSLQGRVRKTKHPLGTQLPSPGASSLDTNWPQTNSVLASISLLAKVRKGEADHACFSRGSRESSEGFWKFFKNRKHGGGGRGGGVVIFSPWCQLPHSKGMKGLRLSFLFVFSSPRSVVMVGGRM